MTDLFYLLYFIHFVYLYFLFQVSLVTHKGKSKFRLKVSSNAILDYNNTSSKQNVRLSFGIIGSSHFAGQTHYQELVQQFVKS